MEDDNTDGKKKKTTASIPANYISILQLQERWINEKEKKRKEEEEEERRQKQLQVEEEKKREEEEKRLNRSNQGRKKKKSTSGGGARFVEKEIPEVTAEVGSGGGEDTAEMLPKKDRGFRSKRYDSKKKKKKKTNQDVALEDDVVAVDSGGCGSIAPTESVVTENVTPAKDVIRVYRKKSEKAATAVETQFEDLSIKRDETTKNLKAQTKPSNRNRAASTMVWVKKERANDDGIASGVKPLNA
ncbi:PREDICTED: myosin-M heavy chain-like [Camelina sativa]|uniref:Myosin-M heavy chain-like n=1 Tax=Camelina sativa TaxID=90675 RepID=A0ABM0SPE7_CAMSA|nr:PREDICTED: myosin-M heavy chain-like [Camelina sativa]